MNKNSVGTSFLDKLSPVKGLSKAEIYVDAYM